jgi:uncharacterized C2H2 Zn-finger protein
MNLLGSRAAGQATAPKRFIAVMGSLGILSRRWVFGTPDSYEFGPGLAPLEPYRGDITVLRGLQPKIANHGGGSVCFLTGDSLQNDSAKHPTIDQVIAASNPPSAAAASGRIVRSLQCGVGVRGTGGRSTMVYQAPGSPLHPKNNPVHLFDEMFGSGSGGSDAEASDTQLRADAKRSILDAHAAELAALKDRAGMEDRQRLDAYLDGIRTLEEDLDRIQGGDVAVGTCSDPNRYDPESVLGAAPYDRIAKAHCDIIGRSERRYQRHVKIKMSTYKRNRGRRTSSKRAKVTDNNGKTA